MTDSHQEGLEKDGVPRHIARRGSGLASTRPVHAPKDKHQSAVFHLVRTSTPPHNRFPAVDGGEVIPVHTCFLSGNRWPNAHRDLKLSSRLLYPSFLSKRPRPSHLRLAKCIRHVPTLARNPFTRQHVRGGLPRNCSGCNVSHLWATNISSLTRHSLYGLTSHQTFRYYRLYPTDPLVLKLMVSLPIRLTVIPLLIIAKVLALWYSVFQKMIKIPRKWS